MNPAFGTVGSAAVDRGVQQAVVSVVSGVGVQAQAASRHPGRLENRSEFVLPLVLQSRRRVAGAEGHTVMILLFIATQRQSENKKESIMDYNLLNTTEYLWSSNGK